MVESNSNHSIMFPFGLILLRKVLIPRHLSSYELNSITSVLLQWWIWHLMTCEGWCAIKQRNQTIHTHTHTHRFILICIYTFILISLIYTQLFLCHMKFDIHKLLVGWLVGWLVDWLVGWLVGWLVVWLNGWLIG